MKEYVKEEKAIAGLQRRLEILLMFTRKNQELTTKDIIRKLLRNGDGDDITDRSVSRNLELLEKAGFLEAVMKNEDDDELGEDALGPDPKRESRKNCKWRWPIGLDSRLKVFPKLTIGEIIAFRLVELILKPLLPRESYEAIKPYLTAVQKQCDIQPKWQRINQWEKKVRVIPPAQPLLPPDSPFLEPVREAILEALFRDLQCQIAYQQIWRDAPTEWTIHPLVYLQRGPAFYLLCMINDYTDVRQLALHRMRSAKVLDSESRKPEGFNYHDYIDQEVERNQGMGGSHTPIRLVARFWKKAGLHLQETRLSVDQVIENDEDSESHFWLTATVNDSAQLRWWLLSFGQNVEVFQPEALRAEMAHHAYWMHQRYTKKNSPAASVPED
jgi:predicted DNA-binding transcriptional regulator YafY